MKQLLQQLLVLLFSDRVREGTTITTTIIIFVVIFIFFYYCICTELILLLLQLLGGFVDVGGGRQAMHVLAKVLLVDIHSLSLLFLFHTNTRMDGRTDTHSLSLSLFIVFSIAFVRTYTVIHDTYAHTLTFSFSLYFCLALTCT